jgi:alpha-mannosidase
VLRHQEYTRARLAQTAERLLARVYADARPVDELLVSPRVDRISRDDAQSLEYRPATVGERFGPLWATYWFRLRARMPEEWGGRRVDLLWDSNSEATLWLDRRAVQGLNRHHRDAVLVREAEPGSDLACEVEMACNGLFGRQEAPVELHRCDVAAFDEDSWQLYFDFETLRALEAQTLDPVLAGGLLGELDRFCTVWEHDPDGARPMLSRLHELRNGTLTHELAALGHAHIDTAWLWPLAETYRKCVRTFSSQTRYMDDYPEYRFACSQAQQYAWIKERDPDLWGRIREKVASGQWVPVGGTWVEPDLNIPSGESLARQFLHGQRFFESEFGSRCRELWAPDAFGYNGQLPQLMREAGINRFLTQKLSWNRFTKPEHNTFVWQGIDGSEVLAHFPPADTYSSEATVEELLQTVSRYKDHDHSRTSLLLFGLGDGGGGPTKAMLETLRRARDLQGLARTTQRTPDEFFAALEAETAERPVVVGELYFEYHRGTYTTQARTKRGNRRCEQALHDAEFLACARETMYPRAELERLWKLLLLQQFHDILPGSSITLVYEDADRDLAEVEAGAHALCSDGDALVNTVGVGRREVVDGAVYEAAPYAAARAVEPTDEVRVDELTLENAHLRATFSPDGSLLSVYDKAAGREALGAPGNRLELYDDRPVAFDAWDVDPFHLATRRDAAPAESHETTASPLRGEIRFERPLGDASRLVQVARLDAESRRLEFHTTVDWNEEHTLLKVCFPLAVRAPFATYEMQFGYAERPTHFSTAYDAARYEVPGHRFADLSEHGYGVSLLTDSKYGYSCYAGELRISLLRSPRSPDPQADKGRHEFAYALVPHAGGWREAGTVAEAIRFNAPLRRTAPLPVESFASVDDTNLVLDTIKRAEDSDALVLRLYDAHGARGTARLRLASPPETARRANALEDDGDELAIEDGGVVLGYRPHEILTVKVT